MGNTLLAAAANSSGSSSLPLIIILVLIFGIFYFLMIRPQRNRQRQVMQVQNSVVVGQRVRTTAGMYGTVTAVDDGDVVIEIAPGVEVRYLKRAIMDVLSDAPADGMRPGGTQPGGMWPGDSEDASADEPPVPEDEPGAARGSHAAE